MILARVRFRLATTDQCARHFRCFGAGVKKIKKGRGRRIHSIYNGLAVDELSGSQSWHHPHQKSGNIPEVIRDLALCHRGFPERFSEVAGSSLRSSVWGFVDVWPQRQANGRQIDQRNAT